MPLRRPEADRVSTVSGAAISLLQSSCSSVEGSEHQLTVLSVGKTLAMQSQSRYGTQMAGRPSGRVIM